MTGRERGAQESGWRGVFVPSAFLILSDAPLLSLSSLSLPFWFSFFAIPSLQLFIFIPFCLFPSILSERYICFNPKKLGFNQRDLWRFVLKAEWLDFMDVQRQEKGQTMEKKSQKEIYFVRVLRVRVWAVTNKSMTNVKPCSKLMSTLSGSSSQIHVNNTGQHYIVWTQCEGVFTPIVGLLWSESVDWVWVCKLGAFSLGFGFFSHRAKYKQTKINQKNVHSAYNWSDVSEQKVNAGKRSCVLD